MISPEELRTKISTRAKRQFARDIVKLKALVHENGGCVSIDDALRLAKLADEREQKSQKKFFGFRLGSAKINEDNYAYTFLLKFMAGLEVDKLNEQDFDSLPLGKLYMEKYKKEYEEYQNYLFVTHDAQFYSGVYPVIKGGKWSGKIEIGDGEVENY